MGQIRQAVQVGFTKHDEAQSEALMPPYLHDGQNPICVQEYDKALKSLGTLGGGNHFIEIQNGSDGFVWWMVHSGSRNFG